jgi:hypothetical protein
MRESGAAFAQLRPGDVAFSYQWLVLGTCTGPAVQGWRRRLGERLRRLIQRLDRPQLALTIHLTPPNLDTALAQEAARHAQAAFIAYLRDRAQEGALLVIDIENEWARDLDG